MNGDKNNEEQPVFDEVELNLEMSKWLGDDISDLLQKRLFRSVFPTLKELDGDVENISDVIEELYERMQKLEAIPSDREVKALLNPLEQRVDKVRSISIEVRSSLTEFQQKIEKNIPELLHGLLPQIGSLRNEMQTVKSALEGRIGFLEKLIYALFIFIIITIGGTIILPILGY